MKFLPHHSHIAEWQIFHIGVFSRINGDMHLLAKLFGTENILLVKLHFYQLYLKPFFFNSLLIP